MKQIKLTFLFFLLSSLTGRAQQAKEVPTALSMMTISVMEDLYPSMELDPQTMFALSLQQPNDKAEELMFTSFDLIRNMMLDSAGIDILPVDALQGKVRYSRLGFPLVSLKKAAKKSDYQQYVKVDIEVSPFRPSTSTGTIPAEGPMGIEVDQTNYQSRFRPEVTVRLKFADASGKSLGTLRGVYVHDEKVQMTSQDLIVSGWQIPINRSAAPIPYYYFLQQAVADLVGKGE